MFCFKDKALTRHLEFKVHMFEPQQVTPMIYQGKVPIPFDFVRKLDLPVTGGHASLVHLAKLCF